MHKRVLGMFAKWPEPGRVKTRLAAQIGTARATAIAHAMLLDSLHRFNIPNTTLALYYSPPEQRHSFETLSLHPWILAEQSPGNLGDRLQNFFLNQENAFTVVIGSDSPSLPADFLNQAFEQLQTYDAVVGPARDGGFYLLGLKSFPTHLLKGIEWSTERVCRQLLANIQELGLTCFHLPTWFDIDTKEDLAGLNQETGLIHLQKALHSNNRQDG